MPPIYLDFDLLIEPTDATATTYRARVLYSPAGQTETSFAPPLIELELENFLLSVGRPRRGLRAIGSPEMVRARTVGRKLYEALFNGPVYACLLRSLDLAEEKGHGLRIRLRLASAPALADLPWEYLYDPSLNRFLSHSVSTPVVRFLDLPRRSGPLAISPPLKVLVVIANPTDVEPLDVEAEWGKVQASLSALEQRGLVQITRLPTATLAALQRQLRRSEAHILHVVAHGGFNHQTQEGVLLLEDEQGRSRLVSGNQLGTLLHDHRASLRLALLNACEGARTALSDPFAGVAQQLVQQGLPAVVAMQFEITDRAAITLAESFYEALADGYPVDAALGEARKAIYTSGNDIEWGTPVLYLRAADGLLFQIEETKEQTARGREQRAKSRKPSRSRSGAASRTGDGEVKDAGVQEQVEPGRAPAHGATATTAPATEPAQVARPEQPDAETAKQENKATEDKGLEEQAHAKTEPTQDRATPAAASAQPRQSKIQTQESKIDFDWVTIPAGPFWMGSDRNDDPDAFDNEFPQHWLNLPEFRIARTPVTVAQFARFVQDTGYRTTAEQKGTAHTWVHTWDSSAWKEWQYVYWAQPRGVGSDVKQKQDHPVTCVSWDDVLEFCCWADVRLPTEAEWEKAARGTDKRIYPWGNLLPDETCCNFDNRLYDTTPVENYARATSPYGLLDMAGNVWEWTSTKCSANYQNYRNRVDNNLDGQHPRIVRGGSFRNHHQMVRCAARDCNEPFRAKSSLGFRVVSPDF